LAEALEGALKRNHLSLVDMSYRGEKLNDFHIPDGLNDELGKNIKCSRLR